MSRTLADMTPAERQQMIGMWAEVTTERRTVIITGAEGATVRWIDPGNPQRWGMTPGSFITPRLDLPRAWTPSGEPVPGEWEEKIYQDGIGDYIRFTRQRRHVTDWEVPHESR